MLKPYFRFIQSAEIFRSPIDIKGNDFGQKVYDEFSHWDSALALPNVSVKITEHPKAANAFMKITYKNGWTNQYAFKDFNYQILKEHLKVYAHIVDCRLASRSGDGRKGRRHR